MEDEANTKTPSLDEVKNYLRVDGTSEDKLINRFIASAITTIENILRHPISDYDVVPDDIHTAILYTVAYLYEYRETADFDAMIKFLRAILTPYRKEAF
ncbi:head-tail connector protein [Limosilactobacillus fermentum]|uniref:head-tail connector protein n=1 Tax=Limosilactobacillus fermentum TaxID=1613 RepID=UPI00256FD878|nr:head-tail connector protein [Limosilactobacillus fermentum]WJD84487.1 head-tail connector protein [Limosilactobacillus fermentum]